MEKKGRTNLYTPVMSRKEYLAGENRSFINRLYKGSISDFAAALCDSGISKEDERFRYAQTWDEEKLLSIFRELEVEKLAGGVKYMDMTDGEDLTLGLSDGRYIKFTDTFVNIYDYNRLNEFYRIKGEMDWEQIEAAITFRE